MLSLYYLSLHFISYFYPTEKLPSNYAFRRKIRTLIPSSRDDLQLMVALRVRCLAMHLRTKLATHGFEKVFNILNTFHMYICNIYSSKFRHLNIIQ